MARETSGGVAVYRSVSGCVVEHPEQKVWVWDHAALKIDAATRPTACFGYILAGTADIVSQVGSCQLTGGQFFCLPAPVQIAGGQGIVVEHFDLRPIPLMGGPIESSGRLRYISGCTDTLLIAPLKFGMPCLNALYFPPQTAQQAHTHPSVRIGVVATGNGRCLVPNGTLELDAGAVFVIPANAEHHFETFDEELVVVAYHPDSDFGPRDEDHPMINRTHINGVSLGRAQSQDLPKH